MQARQMAINTIMGLGRVLMRKKDELTVTVIEEAAVERIMDLCEERIKLRNEKRTLEQKVINRDNEILVLRSDRALWQGRYEGALEVAKLYGLAGAAKSTPAPTPPAEGAPIETDALYSLLALVLEDVDQVFAESDLDSLTVAERATLQKWAGATHLNASDNDDVEVPERPSDILEKLGYDESEYRERAKARVAGNGA